MSALRIDYTDADGNLVTVENATRVGVTIMDAVPPPDPEPEPGGEYLADVFPGAAALLSLSLESSSYNGACLKLARADGSDAQDLGFIDGMLDMDALEEYLGNGEAWPTDWFDQSGNGSHASVVGYRLIIDGDGLPALIGNDKSGITLGDKPGLHLAKVNAYVVGKIGCTGNDGAHSSVVVCGWMGAGDDAAINARWALMFDDDALEVPRNGQNGGWRSQRTSNAQPSTIPVGNGQRTGYAVWEYSSEYLVVRCNDAELWNEGKTASITYPGSGNLRIGCNGRGPGNQTGTGMSLRAVAIYPSDSDHTDISNLLGAHFDVEKMPAQYATADGFLWTPKYSPSWILDPEDDANGMRWWYEHGGYADDGVRGPSFAIASNVANGKTLVRLAVAPGDNDTIVTGAERAERGGRLHGQRAITRGGDFDIFLQMMIEDGAQPQSGDWCYPLQAHYDGGKVPDLIAISAKGGKFQVQTQDNRRVTDANFNGTVDRGTPVPIVPGVWFAMRLSGHWSADGRSDTLTVHIGRNGAPLPKVVDVRGQLYATDTTGAYVKQGVYRGYPNTNAGVFAMRVASQMFDTVADAFSGYVDVQPDLPRC